jgi:hypothetical protein
MELAGVLLAPTTYQSFEPIPGEFTMAMDSLIFRRSERSVNRAHRSTV